MKNTADQLRYKINRLKEKKLKAAGSELFKISKEIARLKLDLEIVRREDSRYFKDKKKKP